MTPKLKLAVNKILTEFYAYSGLPLEVINDRLSRIFKLDESGDDIMFCNFELDVRIPNEGEVSHLIVIRTNNEKKLLYGYVEIVNVICGYTIFDNNYTGPQVDYIYHQDALTGEKLDVHVNFNTEAIITVKPNFDKLANNVLENARSKEQIFRFNSMLEKIKNRLNEDMEEGKISEGENEQQFIVEATQLAARMMVFDFPDDVGDFSNEEEKMVNYIHSVIKESGKGTFEYFYHQMVGKEFQFEGEAQVFIMEAFNYKRHVPKKDVTRLKVFCYFKAKGSNEEKYYPVKKIFDILGFPPPPLNACWL